MCTKLKGPPPLREGPNYRLYFPEMTAIWNIHGNAVLTASKYHKEKYYFPNAKKNPIPCILSIVAIFGHQSMHKVLQSTTRSTFRN